MLQPGKRYECFQVTNVSDWEETRLRNLIYKTLPKVNSFYNTWKILLNLKITFANKYMYTR